MGMGSSKFSDDHAPLAEINITPFVDVVLVLLIIFMVTAPMLESGIPIQLPKASGKALKKPQEPLVLGITKDQAFFLNDSPVPAANLISSIERLMEKRQDREIFIRADGDLTYAFVAQTMAAIKAAGIHKIGLVTLPAAKSEAPKKSKKARGKKK